MYRVLHMPVDEAILLNSREKAPYMICIEVLKCEMASNFKEASSSQKLSQGGIPLENGDAFLQKPPLWTYPLWTAQEAYRYSNDRMSRSTAQAIDQAMTHVSEPKFVSLNLSVETQYNGQARKTYREGAHGAAGAEYDSDLEWVRVRYGRL